MAAAVSADAMLRHTPMCERTGASALRDDREVREAHYLTAYAQWGADWAAVVDHAVQAMPEPGAEQVAIAALVESLRWSCLPPTLETVREQSVRLLQEPTHDTHWTPTLQSLAKITSEVCGRTGWIR